MIQKERFRVRQLLYWLLVNTLAWLIGGGVSGIIEGDNDWLIGGIIACLLMWLAQWFLLQSYFEKATLWLILSPFGFIAGILFGGFTSWYVQQVIFASNSFQVRTAEIVLAIMGASVGLLQSYVLRHTKNGPLCWIFISSAAWTLGGIGFSYSSLLFFNMANLFIAFVIGYAIFGLIYGALTGVALVWILDTPKQNVK